MRQINKPAYGHGAVYQACVNSIQRQELANHLLAVAPQIIQAEAEYDQRATIGNLFMTPFVQRDNADVVIGEVTKQDFKNLYTQQLVPRAKQSRQVYDQLLSLAPQGLCPLCGLAQAETLDHYLSKDGFAYYSVNPLNLVPACRSCNFDKRDAVVSTIGEQPLHPYYDHGSFISDQWLYAEILHTNPVSVQYIVRPPDAWSQENKDRAAAHFRTYDLARKFAVQTTSELSTIKYRLQVFCISDEQRRQRLNEDAVTARNAHVNSWQTALYQALSQTEWYWIRGYAL